MAKSVNEGKWYVAVDCAKCREAIPFAEAPSPAEQPDPIQYRTISDLKCHHCGHRGMYAPGLMSRRQG
jgi:DNA-directed RNA polymerase subunit RPC12/RpoP